MVSVTFAVAAVLAAILAALEIVNGMKSNKVRVALVVSNMISFLCFVAAFCISLI